MAKCSPLHNVTDGARWDAEDLFGRLCIVVHAAFVSAGFLPNSAPAAAPWSLSRRYSVVPLPPHAALRHAAVVLRLSRPLSRRRRRYAHMALRAYVASAGGRHIERRERLRCGALETILSGGIDDTARAIRAPGSAGARLWKLLTEKICRGLFLYACEADGVPVMPDFASLPGDVKMTILEKLGDGKDVAMAESASKELRELVSKHDAEIWKAKYEAIVSSSSYCSQQYLDTQPLMMMRWKEKYVRARDSMPSLPKRRHQRKRR